MHLLQASFARHISQRPSKMSSIVWAITWRRTNKFSSIFGHLKAWFCTAPCNKLWLEMLQAAHPADWAQSNAWCGSHGKSMKEKLPRNRCSYGLSLSRQYLTATASAMRTLARRSRLPSTKIASKWSGTILTLWWLRNLCQIKISQTHSTKI